MTAPARWRGARRWLAENLFSSPLNALITVAALAVAVALGAVLIEWLLLDAHWRGASPADCPDKNAACWPFVRARLDQFIYGLYPVAERWRLNLGVALGLALAAPLWFRVLPVWYPALVVLGWAAIGKLLFLGGWFGLAYVGTADWGGFFLTVVAVTFVLVCSLPLGLALALGRRSASPLIRTLSAAWVEGWRSVPVLVVLFVAIVMFPLFMPPQWEIDKLLRALLALTVLMSAYLAEAFRGALQAIPTGQVEAARALGLNYWQTTFRVVLPQAIPIALPQVTSNFIGLTKETTVLLVIGLYDLLGMVQNAAADPAWYGPGTLATGYFFAGAFFWILCFSISRASARLERRLMRRGLNQVR